MNILFVSHAVPDDNGRGIQKRAAQHLHALRRLGKVTLVLPAYMAAEAEANGADLGLLDVQTIIRRPDRTLARLTEAAHRDARGAVGRLWSALRRRPEIDQRATGADRGASRALVDGHWDLIFAFRLASAIWLDSILPPPKNGGPPRVVDFDDIESIAMRRTHAAIRTTLLWRVKLRQWEGFVERVERRLARSWSLLLLCSERDAALVKQRYDAATLAIPNAVAFADPPPEPPAPPFRLLFVGTFSYGPNVYGLTWFVEQVWPGLREALGNGIELHAIGFDPPAAVLALGSHEGVTIVGPAETLPPHYAGSHAVIAPIFSGGGTRIKIIEAMSFGRPVVTTSLGCEGLDLADGEHALIADSPDGFRDAILRLTKEPGLRSAIARASWLYGRANFAVEPVESRMNIALRQLK